MGVAAIGLLAVNASAFLHARAFTTFVEASERTPPPEELTLGQAAWTVLTGVRVPRPQARLRPADWGLAGRERTIDGPLGTLEVWVLGGGPGVVILVHGYAGERSETLPTAQRLVDAGFTVVAPNLRGSGGSSGGQTSLGWSEAEDVAAVVRWVGAEWGDHRPVLYGFSMGGAAVIGAVARHGAPCRAIVVESTFDRLDRTVAHRFEAMGLPRRGLSDVLLFWGGMQQGFDAWAVAPVLDASRVHVPALVVAGTEDRRVRPEDSRALVAAFGSEANLLLVDGLAHAQVARAKPDVWDEEVRPFLVRFLEPGGSLD